MNEQNLDMEPQVPTVDPVTTETAPEQPTTEQVEKSPAEQTAVEGATTSDDAQQEEVKKRSGFQKRIDELTRQRYERDSQIQALQAERDMLLQQSFQQTTDATKPTIEQFDYDAAAYAKAYDEWSINRQKQEEQQKNEYLQKTAMQQQQIQKQQRIQQKVFEAQAQYPDFIQAINDPNVPNLQEINPAAYEAVIESDSMGAVAMHLAKNPEKVYSFSQMSPVQAVKEVAKLEVMLTAGKPQSPNPAPPPPATDIKGRSDVKVDALTMSKRGTDAYIKWRNAQKLKR